MADLSGIDRCRRCGEPVKLWKGWELCDACGHRHHIATGWHDPIPERAGAVESQEGAG